MLDASNTQIPAPRVPVVNAGQQLMERSWYRFFVNLYNYLVNLQFGSFYDTTDQTAAANTPTPITFNSSGQVRQVSIGTPASRIVFAGSGIIGLTFSIQFTNPSASEDDVYVWLRKNGVDIPHTSSVVTVPKKHGSINGAILMTVDFQESFNAGDYLELCWLTVSGLSQIETIPATLTPSKPASPGVILTVSQLV